MRKILTALTLSHLLALAALADPHNVFGTFATEDGTSHVEISDCGDGTPCGRVIWIDPTSVPEGDTPESVRSPASGEPVLGMTILEGFERKSDDWRGGEIYSPKVDKTYSARLERRDDAALEVRGCIAFFCQTQVWQPVTN